MKEITDITQATTVGTYSISNLDLSGVHKACSSVLSPVLYISHENIDDELIGALVKNSMIGAYKLKKNMATKDDWDRLVSESEKMNLDRIVLYSNTILESAIHLYKKYGFTEVEMDKPHYKRANIKMELNLKLIE